MEPRNEKLPGLTDQEQQEYETLLAERFAEEVVSRLREERIKQLYLKGQFIFDDKNPPVHFGAFPPEQKGD